MTDAQERSFDFVLISYQARYLAGMQNFTPLFEGVRLMVTHPGGGHADDLVSASLMASILPGVPIERRDATAGELEDPSVLVFDTGMSHDPSKRNFDHHQLPPTDTRCALSLLLEHMGVRDKALRFWSWLEALEVLDTHGPRGIEGLLGLDFSSQVRPLLSPVQGAVTKWWAASRSVSLGSPLHSLLSIIGSEMMDELSAVEGRLDLLSRVTEFARFGPSGAHEVAFVGIPSSDKPTKHIDHFWESRGSVPLACISEDERGAGTTFFSSDTGLLDFRPMVGDPEFHFVASSGWVAKSRHPASRKLVLEVLEKCLKAT